MQQLCNWFNCTERRASLLYLKKKFEVPHKRGFQYKVTSNNMFRLALKGTI